MDEVRFEKMDRLHRPISLSEFRPPKWAEPPSLIPLLNSDKERSVNVELLQEQSDGSHPLY